MVMVNKQGAGKENKDVTTQKKSSNTANKNAVFKVPLPVSQKPKPSSNDEVMI